jgi:hypothetical protein
MAKQPRPPITDSPWFWLLLFSAAAIGGLLAIAPKYAIRQAGVEQKSAAREEVARRRQSADLEEHISDNAVEPPTQRPALQVPLWTLAGTVGVLLMVIATAAWQLRRSPVALPGDDSPAEKPA